MMEKEIKFRSPKNKFVTEIHFSPALKETGSRHTGIGAMTYDEALARATEVAKSMAGNLPVSISVRIYENIAEYPRFDWKDLGFVEIQDGTSGMMKVSRKMQKAIEKVEKEFGPMEKRYFIEVFPENRVGRGFYDGCTLTDPYHIVRPITVNHNGECS